MVDSKKLIKYIVDWTFNFIKNKDLVFNNIVTIEKSEYGLYVKFKNKQQFYTVIATITDVDTFVQTLREKPNQTLVTLNSKENFQLVIKNWKRFIDYSSFTIMFINPFSGLDTKWIICPYTHNKICDDSSLEAGLKSMFNTVEQITEEQLQSLISNTRK